MYHIQIGKECVMTEIAHSVMEKTAVTATESTTLTKTAVVTRGSSFPEFESGGKFESHSPPPTLPALSPLFRKAGSLWHPHVYGMPPKQPTPFSIDFILNGGGGRQNGTFRDSLVHRVSTHQTSIFFSMAFQDGNEG